MSQQIQSKRRVYRSRPVNEDVEDRSIKRRAVQTSEPLHVLRPRAGAIQMPFTPKRIRSSLAGFTHSYEFEGADQTVFLSDYLAKIKDGIRKSIISEFHATKGLKAQMNIKVKMTQMSPNGLITQERELRSSMETIIHIRKINAAIKNIFTNLESDLEVSEGAQSGWKYF